MNCDLRSPLSRRCVPALLAGFGCLLFSSFVVIYAVINGVDALFTVESLYSHVYSVFLSGIIVLVGWLLARSDVRPEQYPRAALWSVLTAALVFGLNVPLMLIFHDLEAMALAGWAHGVFALGASGGAIIGLIEARAIERAQRAERARVRAEASEEERERIDYLNSLLRHEVLNNVQVVRSRAVLAREYCNGATEDHLTTIQSRSEDMARVVKDVRALLDAFRDEDDFEEVDLSTLLTSELTDLRTVYDSVEVETDIPDEVYVLGTGLLRRVFGNLLSNAVEHNDSSSPRVTVSVEREADIVSVRIADNGSGIPDEKRESLFERSDGGDHGVGLYLARELVERYDGAIELTESGPEGSMFTVELARPSGSRTKAADSTPLPEIPAPSLGN